MSKLKSILEEYYFKRNELSFEFFNNRISDIELMEKTNKIGEESIKQIQELIDDIPFYGADLVTKNQVKQAFGLEVINA